MVTKYDEENSVFETEENGIQDKSYVEGDKVRMYEETPVMYPNIVLETDEIQQHQGILINNIVSKVSLIVTEEVYHVYLKLRAHPEMVSIGVLTKERLHIVLGSAFESFEKKVMLSEDNVYTGDLVYTFVPPKGIDF